MEVKQISESTIKITIKLEDLEEHGMEMADFLVPQEKTEEFFYTILDELEMPESFLDSGMLSFRVTPKPDKLDVFVTKSKVDKNLNFEDLADLPDMDELSQMTPDEFLKTLEKNIFENKINTKIYRVHIRGNRHCVVSCYSDKWNRCAVSKSDGEGGTSNRFHRISCNWILSGKRGSETDCRPGRVSGGNL